MSRKFNWDFRDVSAAFQGFREFLLGRKHTLHNRFPPFVAPRTIPPPDIPRGPEYKYSKQYYLARSAYHSVKPPVVAPIAEGPRIGTDPTKSLASGSGTPADSVHFHHAPTPGPPFWWDGHHYFCYAPDYPTEINPFGSPPKDCMQNVCYTPTVGPEAGPSNHPPTVQLPPQTYPESDPKEIQKIK